MDRAYQCGTFGPMNESKTESLRVNITPELRKALEAIAAQHDVSVAHVVRRAIRLYLQEKSTVH